MVFSQNSSFGINLPTRCTLSSRGSTLLALPGIAEKSYFDCYFRSSKMAWRSSPGTCCDEAKYEVQQSALSAPHCYQSPQLGGVVDHHLVRHIVSREKSAPVEGAGPVRQAIILHRSCAAESNCKCPTPSFSASGVGSKSQFFGAQKQTRTCRSRY
jgi:hypothetical protein